MNIRKIQMYAPGYKDIIHLETDSNMVLMNDGRTLQNTIDNIGGVHGIYRQAIINGNFEVCQRTLPMHNISQGYTLDRWYVLGTGCGSVYQRYYSNGIAEIPGNPRYSMLYDVTGSGGQDAHFIEQPIENMHAFAGKKVSVSFWLKCNTAINIGVKFYQQINSQAPAFNKETVTQNFIPTNTWKKYSFTFDIPAIDSGATISSPCLRFMIVLPLNFLFQLELAQVQMNVGEVALPFNPKSYEDELRDCMRYYEEGDYYVNGYTLANQHPYIQIPFKVKKRTNPNCTQSNAFNYNLGSIGVGVITNNVMLITGTAQTTNSFEMYGKWKADSEIYW